MTMTIKQQLREARKQSRPLGAGSLADVRTGKPPTRFHAKPDGRHLHVWLSGETHTVCVKCGLTMPNHTELPLKGQP